MAGELKSKTLSEYLGLPEPQETINNYANLDNSKTMIDGEAESNSNKIWNKATPAELQMKIGDTIGNYAITTDEKGNKYQMVDGQVVPFTGETRRFYSYGTKDKTNPDAVKFGLSSGKYNTSDARYSPVLGWASGETGVDTAKKIVDVELPYDKATELEAVIHGNENAMQARLARLDKAKQKKLLGSGYTEYYSSMEGALGNTANVDIRNVQLPQFMDAKTQAKAYNQNGYTNIVDEQGNRIFDKTQYEAPEGQELYGRSIGSRAENALKAAGATAAKGFYDIADVVTEMAGGDLGTEEEKRTQTDKLFGVDRSYQNKSNEKISKLVDRGDYFGAIVEGASTWENLGDSIGYLMPLAVGGPTSLAGKGVVTAAKGLKAAQATGDAAKIAEATKALEMARENYFGAQKAFDFVSKNAGLFALSAGTANDDLEKYAKEAKITKGEISAEKMIGAYLGSVVSNAIDKVTDLGILKSPEFSQGLIQVVKGMTDKQLVQMGKGLATASVAVGTNSVKEGSTEYVQQFLEQVGEQVGEQSKKTIMDAWNDEQNKKERVVAGVQGVSGAGQMTAVSTVSHVSGVGATSAASKMVNKLAERATTRQNAPVEETTIATPADFQANVDSKRNSLEEAIANNKIGTATKLFNSLNQSLAADTEGYINRDQMVAYKNLLQEKHNEIKQRIADNNGVLDNSTVLMLGSDKESISGIVDAIDTNVLEEAVMNGRITDEAVLKQVNGTIAVRKNLEQVNQQVVGDFASYWKKFNESTDEQIKDRARMDLTRLTTNEIDKLDSMQAAVAELEADIKSDMIARRDQGIAVKLSDYGDVDGKGIVKQYPAGGEYQIHRRNIAEKVMSELAGREPVRNGVYKMIDAVTKEVEAAKTITGAVNSIAENTVAAEVPTEVAPVETIKEIVPEKVKPVETIIDPITDEKVVAEPKQQTEAEYRLEQVQKELDYLLSENGKKERIEDVGIAGYREELAEAKQDLKEAQQEVDRDNENKLVDNEQVVDEDVEVPAETEAKVEVVDEQMKSVLDNNSLLIGKKSSADLSKLSNDTRTMFEAKLLGIKAALDRVVYSNVISDATKKESPMQMLMVKEKGKYVYPNKVIEAFTLSIVNYVAERYFTLLYNDDKQIQKMLNTDGKISKSVRTVMAKVGRLHDLEADTLGRMILKEAGVGVNTKEADYDLQARMAVDAGTIAIAVMENLGFIKSKQELTVDRMAYLSNLVDGNVQENKYPEFDVKQAVRTISINPMLTLGKTPKWLKFAKYYQNFAKTVKEETGGTSFIKTPRTSVNDKTIEFKTRNAENWTNITEVQQDNLNIAENTPFKINREAIALIERMWGTLVDTVDDMTPKQIEFAKMFGWDTVDDKHVDSRDGVKAKNRDIMESIQQLITFNKENADDSVYFDYFFSKNGRFFMDSNTINPQTDKLHRFIVTVAVDNETVDSEESRVAFKTAVVQAFDGSKVVTWNTGIESDGFDVDIDGTEIRGLGAIDKQGQEANLRQFEIIRNNEVVQEAVKAIAENSADVESKVLAAINGVDHPGHAIVALQELANYKEDVAFDSRMTIETDGITSGFLLGLMTNPIMEFSKLAKWLAKGGVWLGDVQYKTYGEWKEAGNRDSYETSADGIQKALSKDMYKISNSNVLNFVGKVDRKFMKNPLMIFVYGASLGRIRNEIAQKYADKMIEDLAKGESIEDMLGMVKDSIEGLKEYRNSEKVKDDKVKTGKIDFLINKQTIAGKWLEVLNRRGDVSKIVKEMSLTGKGSAHLQMLHSIVKSQVNNTYGKEVGAYLEKEFGELVSMRRSMNEVFEVSFDVFKKEYDLRIDAEKGAREKPTQAMIDSVLARMVKEGKVPGIMTIEASSVDEKAPTLKRRKITSKDSTSKVQSKLKDANGVRTQRTVHPMIYEIIANSTAGSVINIHYLDGAIIGKIIADSQGFGVHDAFVAHVNKIGDNVRKYNENVFTMTQEYNMLERVINELDRVYKEDPQTVEEYFRLKSGEFEVTYKYARENLVVMDKTIKDNKKLLAESKLAVTQMAGFEDTMYTREAGQVDVNKPDSVGETMSAIGIIRDTKGMAKEISDKIAEAIKKDCMIG